MLDYALFTNSSMITCRKWTKNAERKTIALLPHNISFFSFKFVKTPSTLHHTPMLRIELESRQLQGCTHILLLANMVLLEILATHVNADKKPCVVKHVLLSAI